MAYLNKKLVLILLSIPLLLISLTSAETTFFEGELNLFILGESGQPLVGTQLCSSLFSSQLSFWTEIGSVFSLIIIAIIMSLIALILLTVNNVSIENIPIFPNGLDAEKVKLAFILIGILAIISVISIAIFGLMCRIQI